MRELTLKEAFELQLSNTKAPKRKPMAPGHIDNKGGIEYLRKLKYKWYRMRDAARELGCAISSVQMYCRRHGFKWSEL